MWAALADSLSRFVQAFPHLRELMQTRQKSYVIFGQL